MLRQRIEGIWESASSNGRLGEVMIGTLTDERHLVLSLVVVVVVFVLDWKQELISLPL